MNFHDARGMYDDIAKWVEECDVEIDWEAIMQCKWWVGPKDWVPPPKWAMPAPFPSRLTPLLATKLLLAQWWHGLHIRPELGDPLDDYVAPRQRGGEGVAPGPACEAATGPNPWKKFLRQIAAIERIEIIELKLIKPEERKALVRMAWIEEELGRREVERNRERVRRQNRGEAVGYMSRKAVPTLKDRAKRGSIESIAELERRGWDEGEVRRWRELAIRKADGARERAFKRMEAGGLVFNREVNKVKKEKRGNNKVEEKGKEAEFEGPSLGVSGNVLSCPGAVGKPSGKAGIERELEVIRVGPNPRILTCRYKELASERVCKVGVRTVANFVRGMKFRMAEPIAEAEYAGVWRYEGKLPRLKGRW